MNTKEALEVFGLDGLPTETQLNRLYRRHAKRYHPDKNPEDPEGAREEFQRVQEAKRALDLEIERIESGGAEQSSLPDLVSRAASVVKRRAENGEKPQYTWTGSPDFRDHTEFLRSTIRKRQSPPATNHEREETPKNHSEWQEYYYQQDHVEYDRRSGVITIAGGSLEALMDASLQVKHWIGAPLSKKKIYELAEDTLEEAGSFESFAQAFLYSGVVFGWGENLPFTELFGMARAIGRTNVDASDVLDLGSHTRAFLERLLGITPNEYATHYSDLFGKIFTYLHERGVDKLELFSVEHACLVSGIYAFDPKLSNGSPDTLEERSRILSLILEDPENLAERNFILGDIRKSLPSARFKPRSRWSRRLPKLFSFLEHLNEEGYTLEEVRHLTQVIVGIQKNYSTAIDTLTTLEQAVAFVEELRRVIPREHLPAAVPFAEAVVSGSHGYFSSKLEPAKQEWTGVFNEFFEGYREDPELYSEVQDALSELHWRVSNGGRNSGEIESIGYPSLSERIPVKTAAYAARRIIHELSGLPCEDQSRKLKDFRTFLGGYKHSALHPHYRVGMKAIQIDDRQREAYSLLASIRQRHRREARLPLKVMATEDVDRLIDIYFHDNY